MATNYSWFGSINNPQKVDYARTGGKRKAAAAPMAFPPAVDYTPSAQWLSQLAQAQQGNQFNGINNGLNMSPTRIAPMPGQYSYSPNAAALSARFLGK